MNISFNVPEWVLYVIGVPVAISVIGLAALGVIVIWELRGGLFR